MLEPEYQVGEEGRTAFDLEEEAVGSGAVAGVDTAVVWVAEVDTGLDTGVKVVQSVHVTCTRDFDASVGSFWGFWGFLDGGEMIGVWDAEEGDGPAIEVVMVLNSMLGCTKKKPRK